MLTTVYPSPDLSVTNNTNVCHYFAKEWVNQGHEVLVIHNYPIYLKIFHLIAKIFAPFLASKFNTLITTSYTSADKSINIDGVQLVRMPLFKPLPHFAVPSKILHKQINKIESYCKSQNFVPDIITGHFIYPHVPMINELKKNYPNAKTCIVVHKQNWKMLKYLGSNPFDELNKIDVFGYRSFPLKREFEEKTGLHPNSFMCYSGIPEHFLQQKDALEISRPINKFIFVGSFIQRKYPEKILKAIAHSTIKDNFTLDYIGDGTNRKIIVQIIRDKGYEKNVRLHGFVDRQEVPNFLKKANCFVMISKDETFGLVYLEAMSMGCITIASRNEGMDGIIEDGENGFLCEAGNEIELSHIINKINTLPDEELKKISKNARNTALKLTDSNVAAMYLDGITSNQKDCLTHNEIC